MLISVLITLRSAVNDDIFTARLTRRLTTHIIWLLELAANKLICYAVEDISERSTI